MEVKLFGLTLDTEAITPLHKMIGGGVIALLILGGGGYYYLFPPYEEWTKLKEENVKLEQSKEDKQNKLKNIDAVKKQYSTLLVKIAAIEKKIPNEENIPSLLIDLERMTTLNSTDLLKFIPGSLQPLELPSHLKGGTSGGTGVERNLRQLPVSINLKGDYPTLIDLFSTFEGYQRTISVSGVSLTPSSAGMSTQYKPLDVNFNLRAFVLGGVK